MTGKHNTTKEPRNGNKRAARTESFRRKNAIRKARRAAMRNSLTAGQYIEWRHLCRHIRFYPAKAREEFFSTGRISSHNAAPADRSPQRESR